MPHGMPLYDNEQYRQTLTSNRPRGSKTQAERDLIAHRYNRKPDPPPTFDAAGNKAFTLDEALLEDGLDAEAADAVLGDLAELYAREATILSSKEAVKRRKARAREVRASLPKSAWRRVLRGFLYSMEMQFYWYGAVALYLISAFAYVIHHSR